MLKLIYGRALKVLREKPLKLWGISLLCTLLTALAVPLCGAVPVLALAVELLLMTAMTMIYLQGYRGEEFRTTDLFACFRGWKTVGRVLGGMGWMLLWILIWGLIPIVGIVFAIIRTYEYRLTPYILLTEPEVPVTDAIKISRERTAGYKGKMFLADFLAVLLPFVAYLLLFVLASVQNLGVLKNLAAFVLTVGTLALLPLFLGIVQAAFYEEIREPTIVAEPEPAAEAAVPAGEVHYCANCGAPVVPGAAFCTNCGNKL